MMDISFAFVRERRGLTAKSLGVGFAASATESSFGCAVIQALHYDVLLRPWISTHRSGSK